MRDSCARWRGGGQRWCGLVLTAPVVCHTHKSHREGGVNRTQSCPFFVPRRMEWEFETAAALGDRQASRLRATRGLAKEGQDSQERECGSDRQTRLQKCGSKR